MNNTHLDQAREWARDNIAGGYFHGGDRALAAARVIQSLPDQWIDAENVREILAEQYMKIEGNDTKWINAATIESLLAPSLPTLADMTPEERQACQWMQAKIRRSDDLVGVIFFLTDDRAKIMFRDGTFVTQDHEDVTPLPGEPKMEYPGDGVVDAPIVDGEPALSLPEKVKPGDYRLDSRIGNSAVTSLPCPEDVPAGEPWIVLCGGRTWVGVRADGQGQIPWGIIRTDGMDYQDVADSEITLVSRLVPETPRKTLVTVEDYRDAPARWICLDETADDEGVFHKLEGPLWMDGMGYTHSPEDMAGTPRTVIWEPAS